MNLINLKPGDVCFDGNNQKWEFVEEISKGILVFFNPSSSCFGCFDSEGRSQDFQHRCLQPPTKLDLSEYPVGTQFQDRTGRTWTLREYNPAQPSYPVCLSSQGETESWTRGGWSCILVAPCPKDIVAVVPKVQEIIEEPLNLANYPLGTVFEARNGDRWILKSRSGSSTFPYVATREKDNSRGTFTFAGTVWHTKTEDDLIKAIQLPSTDALELVAQIQKLTKQLKEILA